MPAAPTIKFAVSMRDKVLQENILRMSRAAHTTVKEQTRVTMRGIVRQALDLNPPGSEGVRGSGAKQQGEKAIGRDLKKMGFAPTELKGFRIITTVFGHKVSPIRVATKENPKFADPDAIHIARLRGGKSRGGKQAWYVSRKKFNVMLARLKSRVGLLSSGWIPAARTLGKIVIPSWIARWEGSGRGEFIVTETGTRLTMRAVNHFPVTAAKEAADMIRRIGYLKEYAIGRLQRQLPYVLKYNLRKAKQN